MRGRRDGCSRSSTATWTSVTKVDDLTVKVTTKTPWKAFPAYLYLEGRAGIMAPAQINNSATCATNMIGTGPFKLNSPSDWKVNESLKVVKNPDYWRKDAKGNALPCAELDHVRADPRLADA